MVNLCCDKEGSCSFHLTDDDVQDLAVALPFLVALSLGRACRFNACRTTVSSLLSISIHCLGLELLEIHFNTRTITGDIQRLLDEDSGRGKPRCKLRALRVGRLPLEVQDEQDIGTIATGFLDIFPSLKFFPIHCLNFGIWEELAYMLRN